MFGKKGGGKGYKRHEGKQIALADINMRDGKRDPEEVVHFVRSRNKKKETA